MKNIQNEGLSTSFGDNIIPVTTSTLPNYYIQYENRIGIPCSPLAQSRQLLTKQ
jgi:hypothetical protein